MITRMSKRMKRHSRRHRRKSVQNKPIHAKCRRMSIVHENRMLGGRWKRYKAANGTRVNRQVIGNQIKSASLKRASPLRHQRTGVVHQGVVVAFLTEVGVVVVVEEVVMAVNDRADQPLRWMPPQADVLPVASSQPAENPTPP